MVCSFSSLFSRGVGWILTGSRAKVCTSADEIPNFEEALKALGPIKAGLAWHEVGLA